MAVLQQGANLSVAEPFLNAAERLARRRPLATVTTIEICREAQQSTHQFFDCFCYPELLWLALDVRGLDVLFRLMSSATAGTTLGLQQVMAICRARLQAGRHFPLYHQAAGLAMDVDPLLLRANGHLPLVVAHQTAASAALNTLSTAVETGQADGSVGLKDDARIVASLLVAQCRGLVEHCLNQNVTEAAAQAFLAVWTSSLYNMLAVDLESGEPQ